MTNNFFDDAFCPNGRTKFCCLLGNDIASSPSPAMHSRWFKKYDQNAIYLPMPVQTETEFLDLVSKILASSAFLGANVTIPFKRALLRLDFIAQSETVHAVGAANTLWCDKNSKWHLENTDILGIKKSIRNLIPEKTLYTMVVLGSGGAAAAVHYCGMVDPYCQRIVNFSRNTKQILPSHSLWEARQKVSEFDLDLVRLQEFWELSGHYQDRVIVINTLPLGNKSENIYARAILAGAGDNVCYFDLVYTDTDAIVLAKAKNMQCLNGKLMLTVQAQESFFLWTGIRPS